MNLLHLPGFIRGFRRADKPVIAGRPQYMQGVGGIIVQNDCGCIVFYDMLAKIRGQTLESGTV